jgi:hypothetical protein
MPRTKQVEDLAKAYATLPPVLDATRAAAARTEAQLVTMNAALAEFGMTALQGFQLPGSALDPGVTPGTYVPQNPQQEAYREQVIEQFETLARRIRDEMGPDNFVAKEIDYTIGYLRENRLSPADAIRRLQAVLWNWQGGLFQEMSSQDRGLAQLADELLRFISSGQLNF